MLIGFTGKKESGKTTATNYLTSQGLTKASFAKTLKEMAAVLLRALGEDPELYEADKERMIEGLGCTYRYLLQTLGTDWGRNLIHPDLWIMTLGEGNIGDVAEDIRFENEADYVRKHGGIVVHLHRSTVRQDDHISEAGIKLAGGDEVIHNEGSVDSLYDAIDYILERRK